MADDPKAKSARPKISMTDDEVAGFLERSRTATLGSVGPDGLPHLVAMWYGIIDGKLYFETKTKSQKARNLMRDRRIVCMVEAGDTYDQLRGVSVEGQAVIIDDTGSDEYWAAARSVWERYTGPYSDDQRPMLEFMMNKRIVVRIEPDRVRSWDHRKMGMGAMPISGTTAGLTP
jgi:PPOX class probable F420-dependent enzyme